MVCLDFTSEADDIIDLSGNDHTFLIGGTPNWAQGQGAFVTDVSDTVRVIVQPSNDDPIMAQLVDMTMDEDDTLTVALSGSDGDGDDIYFTASPALNVQTSISNDGNSLIVIPNQDWNGTTEIMVSLFDTPGGSDNSTFTLIVNPVDDLPTQIGSISDITFSEDFNTPWSVDLSTLFEDVDNELNYSASLIDNTVASVQVLNNLVDLSSILDANGQTEMILSATSIMEEFSETGSEDSEQNYSLVFDGLDDQVQVLSFTNNLNLMDNLSIRIRFKPESFSENSTNTLLRIEGDCQNNGDPQVYIGWNLEAKFVLDYQHQMDGESGNNLLMLIH